MCLKLNIEKTEQWKKIMSQHKGWIQVWKTFTTDRGFLQSAYRYETIEAGVNKSGRESLTLSWEEKKTSVVYSGCHVFLEPISYAVNFHYDDVVVPVYVKASDFVAVGTFANTIPSAVFMKYVLRKQDHDNALKYKCIIS